MLIGEMKASYFARPEGSESKLNTYRDGFRIVRMIFSFVKNEKPLFFFTTVSVVIFLLALGLGVPVIIDFFETSLVLRLPTALLSASLVILSALAFISGLILDTLTLGRKEAKRLQYLQYSNAPLASGLPLLR